MTYKEYQVYWQVMGERLMSQSFNNEAAAQDKVNELKMLRWKYVQEPYYSVMTGTDLIDDNEVCDARH